MNFFVVEKNRLIPLRQYEAKLNRISFIQRFINRIRYERNMCSTGLQIQKALKRGQAVCYLKYPNATQNEKKDIVARLKYVGYDVKFCHPRLLYLGCEIRVRLEDKEGIDYIPC